MPKFKQTLKSIGRQVRQQTPLAKSSHKATTKLDKTLSRIRNLPITMRRTSTGKAEAIPFVGVEIRFGDLPGEGKLIKKGKKKK